MDATILAILIFLAFSIFTPISLIITSRTLRRSTKRNSVKDSSYESGEESTGSRISVMNEYLHYFSMFIAFEIIAAMVLVWAPVAKTLPGIPSIAVLGLIAAAVLLEGITLLIAKMA